MFKPCLCFRSLTNPILQEENASEIDLVAELAVGYTHVSLTFVLYVPNSNISSESDI
jgi:hypothetical protein